MRTSSVNCIFKTTPTIQNKEYGYSNWKYDLSVWEAFTSLVTSQDKQAVGTIRVVSPTNDLKLIIAELDKCYLKDESSSVYNAS